LRFSGFCNAAILSESMNSGKRIRYVIVGAGAVGCAVGALLSRAGSRVVCVTRPAIAEALRLGIEVRVDDRPIEFAADAVTSVRELHPWADDVLFVTTKSQHTASVVGELSGRYSRSTPVVTLQNGVSNESIAAEKFENIYAGLVFFSAMQLSPSTVVVPPGLNVAIGCYPTGVDELAIEIVNDLSSAGFDALASGHVMSMKYGKLVANLNNATHAITGYWLELGAADADMRALMLAVREEGLRVLEAAGIAVEPPRGEPSPIRILEMTEKLKRPPDPGARARAEALPFEARTQASMWQDLYLGRSTTEAEHLNGEIVRLGEENGVATPYNSALLKLIRRMVESGETPGLMSPSELRTLIAAGVDGEL